MRRSRAFAAKYAPSSVQSAGWSSTSITSTTGLSGSTCGSCSRRSGRSCSMLMRTDRVDFLDLDFDRLSLGQVKGRLKTVSAASPYGYIVTPNVDHVIRIHQE